MRLETSERHLLELVRVFEEAVNDARPTEVVQVVFPKAGDSASWGKLRDILTVPSDDSRILSEEQAIIYCASLGRSTFNRLVQSGRIKKVQVSEQRVGFRLGDLRAFLNSLPYVENEELPIELF